MKSKLLCLALFLLSSCNKHLTNVDLGTGPALGGGNGTAEGFGGGNIYTDRLYNLRNNLLRPATNYLVQGGGNSATFCNFASRCPDSNNPLCAVELTLSTEQINNCGTFLFRNLSALDAQVKNDRVILEAVPNTLVVNGVEVVAATTLEPLGKIQVNITLMQRMSDSELAANLAHEYLHHVDDSAFGFIQDAMTYPALPQPGETPLTGSNLLTAAAQEVVFQSQSLSLINNPPPPDPSVLSAIPAADSMRLTWAFGAGITQSFQIAYLAGDTAPGSCTSGTVISSSVLGAATMYRVEGLAAGSRYSFRVCAQSNGLLSSGVTLSSSTLATAPSPPPNVSQLTAAPTAGTVKLTWASGGGTTQTFQIAYAAGTNAPANCNGGNVILESTVGSATLYTLSGLAPETDYAFRVCAQANGVQSSGTTVLSKTLTAPIPVPPNPSNFAASPALSSMPLTWTSGNGNTAAFQISYAQGTTAPSTCTSGSVVASGNIGNATSYSVTGLSPSTTYSFRLCSVTSGIYSTGIIVSATTLTPPPQADLRVISAAGDSIGFNVNALSDTTVNFGPHAWRSETDAVITLKNNGNGPSSAFSIVLVSNDFKVLPLQSTCFNGNLQAGATCTVRVQFKPLVTGTFSNLITFKYNNGVAAAQTQLSLTGRTFTD